ncbi:ATP-dependent DNA helicase RecQ [Salinibacillus kushneri]|uniref:ATP-dependent DNA helicase RecQ n=1 Tax=Salinibacillus kushneri TaxID=237682 RepID=A0A1I0HZ07_9BACI|nr:ATP-dependent DNA helicase RecQ [Salinibacillus kushneri]SET89365.1 ATP-dependent DNA helicase RecQ [Salinibacillus kushneri]
MNKMNQKELLDTLQHQFGFDEFREGQYDIIQDIFCGEDVLGILPTGTGKSLCYQLPAFSFEGVTVVISPLVSLMIDQVKKLKAKGFKRVTAINSLLDHNQRDNIFAHLNEYKLIYCSPEMLQNPFFFKHLKTLTISLFVVDEAHCISQWGHEFRTDYLKLKDSIKKLGNPTVLALSATATPQVQDDIQYFLDKPNMKKRIYYMDRPNIAFSIEHVSNWQEKVNRITDILQHKPVPTMIYFSSRKWCEKVSEILKKELGSLRIAYYHGGMEADDRLLIQQQFMNHQLDVICCTSAFGMGVDKQDIRLVIHFHLPAQMESFIQEAGRAGRDGKESVSLVLYTDGDEQIPLRLIEQELPTEKQTENIFQDINKCKTSSLPLKKVKEELIFKNELTETQWNFLQYQFEKQQMVHNEQFHLDSKLLEDTFQQILFLLRERTTIKIKKLYEFIRWVKTPGCRRKDLYQTFQKGYQSPVYYCCDHCDFSFSKWNPPMNQIEEKVEGWEVELKRIFHQEAIM